MDACKEGKIHAYPEIQIDNWRPVPRSVAEIDLAEGSQSSATWSVGGGKRCAVTHLFRVSADRVHPPPSSIHDAIDTKLQRKSVNYGKNPSIQVHISQSMKDK